jgi:hypothetical protein
MFASGDAFFLVHRSAFLRETEIFLFGVGGALGFGGISF